MATGAAPESSSKRAAFKAGLFRPSVLSVSVMLLFLFASMVAFVLIPQHLMESGKGDLFATSSEDDDAFVTSKLASLRDRPTEKPLLAIAGASVTHSSFGTEDEVEREYRAEFGEDADVALLSAGRMPLSWTILILDRLPKNRPVILVLGIGPSRFTMTQAEIVSPYTESRFGITSPADRALRGQLGMTSPNPTGYRVLDQGSFYVVRLGAFIRNAVMMAVTGHGVIRDDERYVGRKASDTMLKLRTKAVVDRFENSEAAWKANSELLLDVIELAKQRGNIRLVMVEHPINPEFVEKHLGRELYDDYLTKMRALAARENVPYWTIGNDLRLDKSNFYDWAHISSEIGQGKLRRSLIERLGQQQQ